MDSSNELVPLCNTDSTVDALVEHNMNNGWPDLNPQHRLLMHEIASHGNFKRAARAHGTSPARVRTIMRSPLGNAYYNYLMERISTESIITRQFIEEELLETLEQASGEKEITTLVGKDVYTGPLVDLGAKIRILEAMSKVSGTVDSKKNKSTGVVVNVNLKDAGYDPDLAPVIEATVIEQND